MNLISLISYCHQSQFHAIIYSGYPFFFFFSMAEAPDLPFFIKRSKFNNLPVYTDYKRGGNYKLTVIRKIEGDLQVPK